jgi:MYXO-CTERM domain-containing protein
VAGIGLVLASPMAWAVMTLRGAGQPGTAAAAGIFPTQISTRFFRGGVYGGADLTDPFLPLFLTGGEASDSRTAYLGAAALLLAGLAVWRRRSLWPWLAGALGMGFIALGPWLVVAGEPARSADGAQLMTPLGWVIFALPFLGRVTHWYRAAAVGVLLLAAPVSTLARGWARGLAVAVVVLLDLAICAPMTWPLHSTPVPDTAVFDALVGPGAVLTLPESTSQQPAVGNWRNRILLDQITHGRPISGMATWGGSASPEGSHAQMLVQVIADHGTLDRVEQNGFAGAGFRWLVVYHRLLPHDPARSRRLERCLGTPISGDEEVRIYTLERLRPEGCLGPSGPSL